MNRCAVLGSPIAHSRSPLLHRAAYRALGLQDWRYDAFEVTEPELPGFIAGLTPAWRGLSLTMPLKQAVIPLLDQISPTAQELQSVNTVIVNWDDGTPRLSGFNTDVVGIEKALLSHLPARTGGLRGCVLGAGATAASAVAALSRLEVPTVTVVARRPEEAHRRLADLGERLGMELTFVGWQGAVGELAAADVAVSTVPAGAADDVADSLACHHQRCAGVLLDVVYHPWPTRLAAACVDRGGHVVSGMEMLLYQAAAQVEAMTGCEEAPVQLMRAALAA